MNYYLMNEDHKSESKIYLAPLMLDPAERVAMVTGDIRNIPVEPLDVFVGLRSAGEMPDYLNSKFTLISDKLKNILDQQVALKIFYRTVWLSDAGDLYQYYYFCPPQFECLDYQKSRFEIDPCLPGGVRITKGFYVRNDGVFKADIFRIRGLSNRIIIISERLKKLIEENQVQGVQYIRTDVYQDFIDHF